MADASTSGASARDLLKLWGIAALFVVALAIVQAAAQVLLLAFAGVLFGTVLRGAARALASLVRLPIWAGLVICVVLGLGACVGAGLWIVPRIAGQLAELWTALTGAYEQLRRELSATQVGQQLLAGASSLEAPLGYMSRAAGLLTSAIGLVGAALFVFFVSIYVASRPDVYRDGVVRLVPVPRRERAAEVLAALARTLRRWMLGRLISMTAVGVTTAIGLAALGLPLPVTLGLLAGVLGFVPNIGPIVAAVPALLIAAAAGFADVVYVSILYLAINIADGYVLTPAIQRRAVATPPALVLTVQLLFGALWGILGVTLATPLIACAIVVVRMLYVERLEG